MPLKHYIMTLVLKLKVAFEKEVKKELQDWKNICLEIRENLRAIKEIKQKIKAEKIKIRKLKEETKIIKRMNKCH